MVHTRSLGTSRLGKMRRLKSDNLTATTGVMTLVILDPLKTGYKCGNSDYRRQNRLDLN